MGNLWFVLALGCNVNWLTLPTINFLQWGPGCSKWSAMNCVCQLYVGTYSARGQRSLLPYQQFFGNTLIWFINFRNQIKVFQKNCWCGNTVTLDSKHFTYRHNIQLIAFHFKHPGPHCRKFIVGNVSQFTLQPMANTNQWYDGGPQVFHMKWNQLYLQISIHINWEWCARSVIKSLWRVQKMMMENTSSARYRALAMCTTDVSHSNNLWQMVWWLLYPFRVFVNQETKKPETKRNGVIE